ncbi:MAG: hypothetical protein WCA23_33515 [Stellaceae bacterium]
MTISSAIMDRKDQADRDPAEDKRQGGVDLEGHDLEGDHNSEI